MQVYLIECGRFFILYVKERQEYFIVDDHPEYLAQFKSGAMECDQWKHGLKFNADENALKLFYLPEHNSGAVIASRHSDNASPKVYDKYRFRDLGANKL